MYTLLIKLLRLVRPCLDNYLRQEIFKPTSTLPVLLVIGTTPHPVWLWALLFLRRSSQAFKLTISVEINNTRKFSFIFQKGSLKI